MKKKTSLNSPKYLNSAPGIEHKEDHGFVMHLLQAPKDDEEDEIPPNHLEQTNNGRHQVNNKR